MILIYVTHSNEEEAKKVVRHLLKKKLIISTKHCIMYAYLIRQYIRCII